MALLECWDVVTKRLLSYLADPFNQDPQSRLGRLMASFARELSGCTESVTLTNSRDIRGDGSYTITTRFDPITGVSLVRRLNKKGGGLQTYQVDSFDGRRITLKKGIKYGNVKYGQSAYSGSPLKQGDIIEVTYTYLHKGLEFRIREALQELNILTSTGDFLDRWGRLFGVSRLTTGKYGSVKYGSIKYGGSGLEGDTQYARRIINSILQVRNTKTAILSAVKPLIGRSPYQTGVYGKVKYGKSNKYGSTSGQPYIIEWLEPGVDRGWVFKPTTKSPWRGENNEQATKHHLIWGINARFLNSLVTGGGGCVVEVWVPPPSAGASYSLLQVLQVANSKKAAGIRIYVRQFLTKRYNVSVDSGMGVETSSVSVTPATTALAAWKFEDVPGFLKDSGANGWDLTDNDICPG